MTSQNDFSALFTNWMRALTPYSAGQNSAPSAELNEPINPGWTFGNVINVTETNSSSPATEHAILSKDSYGRQLGHVIEALVDLINERPKATPQTAAMAALIALNKKIIGIKTDRIDARVAEIEAFLKDVKKADAAQYQRVVTKLQHTLASGDPN